MAKITMSASKQPRVPGVRSGQTWHQDEERLLLGRYLAGVDLWSLTALHGRSKRAITKRLELLTGEFNLFDQPDE